MQQEWRETVEKRSNYGTNIPRAPLRCISRRYWCARDTAHALISSKTTRLTQINSFEGRAVLQLLDAIRVFAASIAQHLNCVLNCVLQYCGQYITRYLCNTAPFFFVSFASYTTFISLYNELHHLLIHPLQCSRSGACMLILIRVSTPCMMSDRARIWWQRWGILYVHAAEDRSRLCEEYG